MKIHKYIASSWVCSRRKAEEYIQAWEIFVNGEKAHIWQIIDPDKDKISFWDTIVKDQKELVYYKYNKPRWIITTCASNWESAIVDVVDIKKRVFPVWRLDKDSCGLILLTNDGRLTNYLIHPSYNHEKEYIVETFWPILDDALEKLSKSMYILGSYTKKARVSRVSSGTFSIVLTEWKNRQIRRMVEKIWLQVKKLKRIRIENIEVWDLDYGNYKPLTRREKNMLFDKIWLKNN